MAHIRPAEPDESCGLLFASIVLYLFVCLFVHPHLTVEEKRREKLDDDDSKACLLLFWFCFVTVVLHSAAQRHKKEEKENENLLHLMQFSTNE